MVDITSTIIILHCSYSLYSATILLLVSNVNFTKLLDQIFIIIIIEY